MQLDSRLEKYASEHSIQSKGKLALVLFITDAATRKDTTPFSANDFLTPQKGQVSGLSRQAVQKVLAKHGIDRVLAEEGGRTSRGSIERMTTYVTFLNDLENDGLLDLGAIENWWIERVKQYFASKPFAIRADASKSLRSIISHLIDSAFTRQKECPGTMIAGAVIQHLVGAKLEVALAGEGIEHSGSSVADAPRGRKGDFLVGNTVVHVTTAPSEALIRKCCDNLNEDLRPLIVTIKDEVGTTYSLARNKEVSDRVEILEVEQFVAANVLERSKFKADGRTVKLRELIDIYNRIIDDNETDPSLKIKLG